MTSLFILKEAKWFSAVSTPPGGRGYSWKICVGVCGALIETLTLFQTKLCDFPYHISGLTQSSIPYFRPSKRTSQEMIVMTSSFF